jgi:hypothetical protein
MTTFEEIYNVFLSSITDDMYLELTHEETISMLFDLFQGALPWFEFPRANIYDYDLDLEAYNITLTKEEIKIISIYMIVEWIGQ